MSKLFEPVTFGGLELANRFVMAPMTRSRANEADEPTDLHVEYYRQRAGAGLIITEGVQPSKVGKGYCRTPGIYNDAQITAWRKVTDAVHAEGGKIVMQLMHVGRVANALNKDEGVESVAPSAITAKGEIFTEQGMLPLDAPRALALEEISGVIAEYKQAALNAIEAGCDGVELHCTSGYLPAQFLSTGSNQRTDAYGGSVENRARFPLEVLAALVEAIGADRVGFRICPGNPFNDLQDDNHEETFSYFLQEAEKLGLAYLHVIRMPALGLDNIGLAKANYKGALIINESYTAEEAEQALHDGDGDAVAFGRPFIANPDFVARVKNGTALSKPDFSTLYSPGAKGFTDYPAA